MKRFNFLPVVVAFVLMITAVGCTTMTGTEDGYYERGRAQRVYVDDPYRGTVVLERDPYTGRYYEVNPYGSYNTRIYRGNNGYYGRNNSRYYDRNYRSDRDTYQRSNQNNQRPSDDELKDRQRSRDEARRKVLGS